MMVSRFALGAVAALLVSGIAAAGFAQGNSAGAAGTAARGGMSASTLGTGAASQTPSGMRGVVGSGGSAAAGGTSSSSLGLGAESAAPGGASSAMATGGSAAAPDGHTMSRSGVHGSGNAMNGQSMDQAHLPGGTWSKSHTVTHLHHGTLSSRTKSMAHEPGGPPVQSTIGSSVNPSGSVDTGTSGR